MELDVALAAMRMKLAEEEKSLDEKAGKRIIFTETGPTSIMLMKAVISVIEEQANEIAALRKRLDTGDVRAGA